MGTSSGSSVAVALHGGIAKKEPPMKGTKRWNKQQKAIKRKERKREIWNVMNLIDSLSAGACVAHA